MNPKIAKGIDKNEHIAEEEVHALDVENCFVPIKITTQTTKSIEGKNKPLAVLLIYLNNSNIPAVSFDVGSV